MTVHIVGAGVAGLTCAVAAALAGERVVVYESSGHAGGRCRTFSDPTLEREVDNGIHMLIGANTSAFRYIDMIGSRGEWLSLAPASFPFQDAATGEFWRLRPNAGRLPWWLLLPGRRVAGSRFVDHLGIFRLALARPGDTVADCLGGPLLERLWRPLTEAALNTPPEEASAVLFRQVVRESFLKGEAACRPYLTRRGLTPALVDPALDLLRRKGGTVRFNARLRALEPGARETLLRFNDTAITAGPGDRVVLALPPWAAASFVHGTEARPPADFRGIVNIHYRLDRTVPLPGGGPYLGVISEPQAWLFVRGDVLTAMVSAAEALLPLSSPEIATRMWAMVESVLRLGRDHPPPYRVIREKRATPAHVPGNGTPIPLRPWPGVPHVVLAGDWTANEIPATIEAATRSGFRAADLILQR